MRPMPLALTPLLLIAGALAYDAGTICGQLIR